ncbi:putative aldo-keto reductase 1 [Fagus crenata]
MAGGVESWSSLSAEGEAKLGMVMEFSLDDGGVAAASFSSSPKLPRRLRRRLSESKTPQKCIVQDIEAKLRHANLHRQFMIIGSFHPGTSKIKNLDNNIGSLKVKLTEEHLKEISDAVPIKEVAGGRRYQNKDHFLWKFAKVI